MATFGPAIRRGLPRRPGGNPWPPAAGAPAEDTEVEAVATAEPAPSAAMSAPAVERANVDDTAPDAAPAVARSTRPIRRGLPRVSGGQPWPPGTATPVVSTAVPSVLEDALPTTLSPMAPSGGDAFGGDHSAPSVRDRDGTRLRRGLPRTPGGDPWPLAGVISAKTAESARHLAVSPEERTDADESVAVAQTATATDRSTPLPFTRTAWPGVVASAPRAARRPEPQRYGPFTKGQWAGAIVVVGGGLLFGAVLAVVFVRWLLSLEFMQDFLATYPGEYHLPVGAPVGVPAWLGWQHFFNVFLMVLIIRSGLQVRTEKRPTAFWSPRNNDKRKISLNLWFHQSLDILWVVNGVLFVVLLFVTGQWMRIVPTSWEVIPNAISAGLQYVSLEWPTENGWVNYNSLQQLAYFSTVFLAAPLAILSGVRMSGVWPNDAKTLNRIYPVEWARAVHFPVMLYFLVFIAIHVFLVFATGALRNLNHMYASQGSTDPSAYLENWTGFWFFVASLTVIAVAWVAARPLVLAPIARLFGKVSGR